jgi:hypothetical protein
MERFPGARILDQARHWDRATRDVVMDRVNHVPRTGNLPAAALETLEALCEAVIPQQDRPRERRIPIVPWIAERIATRAPEGFRFDDMPPLDLAWRSGLDGLNETARALFGRSFSALETAARHVVLDAVRSGAATGETWRRMPARRWWIYVALREILGVYYAHPLAWDEIGFGGPAFPRGYASLNHGAREWWESAEDKAARRADLAAIRDARLASADEASSGPVGTERASATDTHGGPLGTPHGLRRAVYSGAYPADVNDPSAAADPTAPPDSTDQTG